MTYANPVYERIADSHPDEFKFGYEVAKDIASLGIVAELGIVDVKKAALDTVTARGFKKGLDMSEVVASRHGVRQALSEEATIEGVTE